MHKTTKELASYDAAARAALDYLKADPRCTGKLGVMGICIGGHLACRAALNLDVLASVCFYATDIHKRGLGRGMNDDTLDRMDEATGEMLMIWGRQDSHVPREGRRLIYDAMNDAGLLLQWHEFNAAHAFLRDEGPRYDPAAARIGYAMALELFGRKLGEGDRTGGRRGRGAALGGVHGRRAFPAFWGILSPTHFPLDTNRCSTQNGRCCLACRSSPPCWRWPGGGRGRW